MRGGRLWEVVAYKRLSHMEVRVCLYLLRRLSFEC